MHNFCETSARISTKSRVLAAVNQSCLETLLAFLKKKIDKMLLHFTVDGQKRKGLETLMHPSMCNFWLGVISLTWPVVSHTQIMWPHFCNIPGMLHQFICICDPWLSVAVLKWIRFMLCACSVHPNGHVMCACCMLVRTEIKAATVAQNSNRQGKFSDSALNINLRNVDLV